MTGGQLGDAPPLYWTLRAARYLGVAPWELESQPYLWEDVALATERAEAYAAEHQGPTTGELDEG